MIKYLTEKSIADRIIKICGKQYCSIFTSKGEVILSNGSIYICDKRKKGFSKMSINQQTMFAKWFDSLVIEEVTCEFRGCNPEIISGGVLVSKVFAEANHIKDGNLIVTNRRIVKS